MQHIELSYQWASPGAEAVRNRQSPLRNPLMDLLQAVRDAGSIGGAANAMGLSYRHVWGELKRWEQSLGQALIIWEKGQAARLTGFADKLLWAERQAQARLLPQISALHADLEKTFAVAFDPAHLALPVFASHDAAMDLLREEAASQALHLDLRFCGSVDAIRALNEGRCHVAGFHAPWQPDVESLVARTYKPLLKTGQHKLIGFAQRSQGLMVAKGNPLGLRDWADLCQAGVRFVNRSSGTGTRLLLDQCLEERGLLPAALCGYAQEENSHAAVAARIASGQADVGLGIAQAAHVHGLDFVPLHQEHYWLVCLASALDTPPVLQLRRLLSSSAWQARLQSLGGYSPTPQTGQALEPNLPEGLKGFQTERRKYQRWFSGGGIDRLNQSVGKFTTWLILIVTLISAGNAIVRKAFNVSSNGLLEIQWYLFAAVFLLGAGYGLLRNSHVRIDFISTMLTARARNWIDAYNTGEMSSNAGGLIRWPVYALVPLGFGLLMLQGVSELIKRLSFLTGAGEDPLSAESTMSDEEKEMLELEKIAQQAQGAR
eukprot:gene33164-40919_t